MRFKQNFESSIFSFRPATRIFYVAAALLTMAMMQPLLAQNFGFSADLDFSVNPGNETDPAVTANPNAPLSVFVAGVATSFTNGGLFTAYTTNAKSWTTNFIAVGGDTNFITAYGEPSVAWDANSNLFLAYEPTNFLGVAIIVSTNGGQTFSPLTYLASGDLTENPRIAYGGGPGLTNGIWVVYKDYTLFNSPLVVQGCLTTNVGVTNISAFSPPQLVPGSSAGGFADIAVGPSNQVMVAYQNNIFSSGTASVFVNVNTNTALTNGFNSPVTVAANALGGFTYIPAATTANGINAGVGLAWDQNPSSHFYGRAYIVYTVGTNGATEVFSKYSVNSGSSWIGASVVNDDAALDSASHFLPRIAVDQNSASVGICWLDCRNDDGNSAGISIPIPGSPTNFFTNIFDLDGAPNTDFMVYGTISTNGGTNYIANFSLVPTNVTAASAPGGLAVFGSDVSLANNAVGLGHHIALAYSSGNYYSVWPDNSGNTLVTPANGTLPAFDFYLGYFILPTADLSVQIIASPSNVLSGQSITYYIVVTNRGPGAAKGISVTNVFGNTVTIAQVTAAPGGMIVQPNGQTFIFNFPSFSLGAGKSLTNSIVISETQSGIATNVASVGSIIIDPLTANNFATNTVVVNGEDLGIAMSATPTNVNIGGTVSYALTVTNYGPSSNGFVYVTNIFPANLTAVTNINIPAGATYTISNNLFVISLGLLASNQTAAITFDATALSVGALFQFATNIAVVASTDFDPNPTNNSATNVVTILGEDLGIGLSASSSNVNVGDVITYTLNITNFGPSASGNLTLSNVLSDNLGQITMVQLPPGSGSISRNVITFNMGQLSVNQVITIVYTAVAVSVNALDTNAISSAIVSSTDFDTNLVNNTASTLTIINGEDLALGLSSTPSVLPLGQPITYVETITNLGSSVTGVINVTNTFSTNSGAPAVQQAPGSYAINGNKIVFQVGTLNAGQAATIVYTTIPTSVGLVTNTAGAGSSVFDTNLLNNAAQAITTVVVPSALISNFSVTALASSVFIVWDTPFNTSVQVAYGLTTNYGNISSLSAPSTHHVVLLTGLARNTNYYFNAMTWGEGVSGATNGMFFTTDTLILNTIDASYAGTWSQGSPAIQGYFGSYFNTANTTPFNSTASAIYTPNIPTPGFYSVSTWYPQNTTFTTNAQMYVAGATNVIIKSVNQTINGGTWLPLASNIYFGTGMTGTVTIFNDTGESNKLVAANAMKWDYVPAQDFPTNGIPPAWWTAFYFGTNTAAAAANYAAYVFGAAPFDPMNTPAFWLGLSTNNTATVTFTPFLGGRAYQLQTSTNLAKGPWLTLTNRPFMDTNSNGIFTNGTGYGIFTVTQTNATQTYYRIAAQILPQ